MTLKKRIDKLEQRADDQDSFGKMYVEWLRAERIRLLNDPEALDRIRLQALREDCGEEAASWFESRLMHQRSKYRKR